MKKKHYRTIFISDIHLWNLKNQWDKLIKFLNSISFDNLIIIWDFIDYRQLKWFWKRTDKDQNTLNYINNLSNNWVKITYIQWNHDRNLKCWNKIYIENMTVIRGMYHKTLQWKTYYITHWDCMDWINKDWNSMWQLWSIVFWLLLRIEKIWNKKTLNNSYLSIAENLEDWIKKVRMPEHRIKKKIMRLTKNINCNWIIIWHFHVARHYNLNWIDYFNTWDWLRNCSALLEDSKWNLELVKY